MPKHGAKKERQQQIIMAAMQCFARNSYANTTMDEIAEECGLSKGSLYRYYKNKKTLFLAILQNYFEGFSGEIDTLFAEAENQEAKLNILINAMNQVATKPELQDLNLITLDFYSLMRFDEEVNDALHTMLQGAMGLFTGIIQEGIDNQEFEPVNARHYALILMGIGDGLGIYQMMGLANFSFVETMDTMQEIILKALRLDS